MLKDFKFFTKEKRESRFKSFSLNVMENPFGRIPCYPIMFESLEHEASPSYYGTVSDLVTGIFGLPLITLVLSRPDGTPIEINHNNVDEVNNRHLIFNMNDGIMVKFRR